MARQRGTYGDADAVSEPAGRTRRCRDGLTASCSRNLLNGHFDKLYCLSECAVRGNCKMQHPMKLTGRSPELASSLSRTPADTARLYFCITPRDSRPYLPHFSHAPQPSLITPPTAILSYSPIHSSLHSRTHSNHKQKTKHLLMIKPPHSNIIFYVPFNGLKTRFATQRAAKYSLDLLDYLFKAYN